MEDTIKQQVKEALKALGYNARQVFVGDGVRHKSISVSVRSTDVNITKVEDVLRKFNVRSSVQVTEEVQNQLGESYLNSVAKAVFGLQFQNSDDRGPGELIVEGYSIFKHGNQYLLRNASGDPIGAPTASIKAIAYRIAKLEQREN